MHEFKHKFLQNLIKNSFNFYKNNWATYRFGQEPKEIKIDLNAHARWVDFILQNVNAFEWLYSILGNEQSKNILLDVLLYKCLGHIHVKHRINTPQYWSFVQQLETNQCSMDIQLLQKKVHKFYHTFLQKYLIDGNTYLTTPGFLINDIYGKQYFYTVSDVEIQPKSNDILLECGACIGDTTLYICKCCWKKWQGLFV